jgi:hypothetical protein
MRAVWDDQGDRSIVKKKLHKKGSFGTQERDEQGKDEKLGRQRY